MDEAEVHELELLLQAYQSARLRKAGPLVLSRTRRQLETALVHHAAELVACARARLPGRPMPPQERFRNGEPVDG